MKGAKLSKPEEIGTKAVCKLADAAKGKSYSLEERNAITIFSRPEAQGLPEKDEFFAELRKIYLERTKKRMCLESSNCSATATIPPPTTPPCATPPVATPPVSTLPDATPPPTSNDTRYGQI